MRGEPVRQEIIDVALGEYYQQFREYLIESEYFPNPDSAPEMETRFCIPKTFYGPDSGHLNFVESDICLNLMSYVFFSELFEKGEIEKVGPVPVDDFIKRQMACYIDHVDQDFKSTINPRDFYGRISLGEQRVRSSGTGRGLCPFSFYDVDKGKFTGKIGFFLSIKPSSEGKLPPLESI